MSTSSIEWTDTTWNPTTGCDKISAGCKFCYAEPMTKRLKAMGQEKYKDGWAFREHWEELDRPSTWKKPRKVFVNSMSDLFHHQISVGFLQEVFKVMGANPQHTFQILTKRAETLANLSECLEWGPNIWMGVSVENGRVRWRIDELRECDAHVKFLSLEPLIGPLPNLDLSGIDWVIVGGESGQRPRQIKKEWVQDILKQCREQGVPFFFKQWGGRNKKKAGRILNGRTYDEMPKILTLNN
ncbi:MAG: phage Gp37/Gp68 family protein [Bacteroidota bacterium]